MSCMWKILYLETCYLASMNDSVITCDEIIESYDKEKKQPAKRKNSIFYLHFY